MVIEAIECGLQVRSGLVGLKAILREKDFYGKKVLWINREESVAVNQNHKLAGKYLDLSYIQFVSDQEFDFFGENINNYPFRYAVR